MLKKIRRCIFNVFHPVIGEVWELHRVTSQRTTINVHKPYEITPDYLEQLILKYKNKGYDFIPISDVLTRKRCKFVAVTLDDGFLDNYEEAYQIFNKHSVPFCIYIMQGGVISENDPSFFPYMSEQHIVALSKNPLCAIGCHTCSHPHLANLSIDMQKQEIESSIEWLEKLTGRKVEDFSYPFGSLNSDTLRILSSAGIKRSCLASGGPIRNRVVYNPLMIPRIVISEKKEQSI